MFRALRVETSGTAPVTRLVELTDDDLMPGDVTVDVEFSSVNFKDGLALAGKPGVIKDYPLIPGIDLVGTVAASASPEWSAGDRVIVTGWGIGETHDGGLSERARVRSEWLVRLPDHLTASRAAAIGTAGFTAMLAVLALENGGVDARSDGDVVVSGAAGGVGSIAIALLARSGHTVVAATGRGSEHGEYLRALGASDILDRDELAASGKPLQSQRWAGAVDSVGSTTLASVLAQTRHGGVVAACGLAGGADLPTTVMPFILRGVTLAGINSVFAPTSARTEAWERLASDLDATTLDEMTTTIPLADAPQLAEQILAGRVRGRTVVDVRA
ncbi:MDR family oxidoreductase [Marisediminicola sp. LYQ134]|uniref:MDR family oxidoreductase n=1 Tax=Marisediminicola sp. LYQ134 TaxID=3391061 RepID=UPI00398328B1